jgi:two-component system, OmpR family, copper resistance phosphate regulon response regulator CusR
VRLLIVEDDKNLAETVKSGLEESGYAVDWVAEGASALEMERAYSYDVIILDIMLPGIDGFTVCRQIRSGNTNTPVLILTARYRDDDKVRDLDCGADDYLVKPFSYPELYARIRALLRRGNINRSPVITAGRLVLDTASRQAAYAGAPVNLTSKEYAILEYLAINRNGVVTRDMLEEHIWDCEHGAFSNVIEVLISRIRKKLCPEDKEAVIKTVKGLGYVVRD